MSEVGIRAVWYFAYGANMFTDVLVRRRGIIPFSSEKARLDGYQLGFQQPGLRFIEPCFASIHPNSMDCVYGVLHHLTDSAVAQIDRFEGRAYQRFKVQVKGINHGWVQAWAYQSRCPIEGRRPSRRYRDLLIAGAQEFNLPEEYVVRLRQIPCVSFPLVSWFLPPLVEAVERIQRKNQAQANDRAFKN